MAEDIDNWEDIPHYELCDEVIRLRAERDDLQVLLRGRTAEFQAEIERLRAEVISMRAERDHAQTQCSHLSDRIIDNTAKLAVDEWAEIERLRAVERRSHDLWWLAYHHGPVTLTVRGSHEMYRTVTVDGISYNVDDPADVALLEARRER